MIILRLLARMSACSISSTCKLLFFPDNKGCVLYITKCNHPPPPPRSFFWSTPPQFSAVDSPDNRAPCVIVEGFYYYYSSLQKEKCSKEIAFTRGQLKGQIEFIRQIVVHLVTVTSVDLYMTMTSLGEFICHGKLISMENVENSLPVFFVDFQVETSFPYDFYFCGFYVHVTLLVMKINILFSFQSFYHTLFSQVQQLLWKSDQESVIRAKSQTKAVVRLFISLTFYP